METCILKNEYPEAYEMCEGNKINIMNIMDRILDEIRKTDMREVYHSVKSEFSDICLSMKFYYGPYAAPENSNLAWRSLSRVVYQQVPDGELYKKIGEIIMDKC